MKETPSLVSVWFGLVLFVCLGFPMLAWAGSGITSWTSITALPQGTASVVLEQSNGFLYALGGYADGSGTALNTVYGSRINGDGTISSWVPETALPTGLKWGTGEAANNYLYMFGGATGGSNCEVSNVFYAHVSADGSLGAWQSTAALPQPLGWNAAAYSNGYVYVIGGLNCGNLEPYPDVYYAALNADGSISSWITGTSLPLPHGIDVESAAVANGFLYVFGGSTGNDTIGTGGNLTSTYYAQIHADGSLGAWQTTGLPRVATFANAVAEGSFVYLIGGAGMDTVNYAAINADGSLGAWGNTTALPVTTILAGAVVANNRIYVAGGYDGSFSPNVYVAQGGSNCPVPIGFAPGNSFGFGLFANLLSVLVNAVNLNFCVSNSSGNALFIPARTTSELQSFYNAASGGRISGVTVGTP